MLPDIVTSKYPKLESEPTISLLLCYYDNSFIGHYSNGEMLSTIITNKKGEGDVCEIGPELLDSLNE